MDAPHNTFGAQNDFDTLCQNWAEATPLEASTFSTCATQPGSAAQTESTCSRYAVPLPSPLTHRKHLRVGATCPDALQQGGHRLLSLPSRPWCESSSSSRCFVVEAPLYSFSTEQTRVPREWATVCRFHPDVGRA